MQRVILSTVFVHIAESGITRSPELIRSIEDRFRVKRRTVQDALGVLVTGGWIERQRQNEDARRVEYVLTDKGRAALGNAVHFRAINQAWYVDSTTSTRARMARKCRDLRQSQYM